jgi:hypothetical protein
LTGSGTKTEFTEIIRHVRWPERRQGQAASQADRVGGREEGRVYYYIGERLKLEGETGNMALL